MLKPSSPLPLLVVFAVLCMVSAAALAVAVYVGDGWAALIFAVGLVGSLVGLLGLGGQP